MKTGSSVPQKAVFGCCVLSSSPLGICITYKAATPTSSFLRNAPVKKLAISVFSELFLVDGISSSWAFSSEKCFFFLHWENKLWNWVGWGWRIHLPVSLLTFTWGPLWLVSFFGAAQLELVAYGCLGWHMSGWNQAATEVVHTKHGVGEVGILLGFFLLVMRTVTCTPERTVLNQLPQFLLLAIDEVITFLTPALVLDRAALWFILEGKTSLELLCSLKLWGLNSFHLQHR